MSQFRPLAQIGLQTQTILSQGEYTNLLGETVEIASQVERAKAGRISYPPQAQLSEKFEARYNTRIYVHNQTTLSAAQLYVATGYSTVALNFASARHPGGGWLSGAQAQEESLGRASGLVTCIEDDEMYQRHLRLRDALYTNSAIYSPEVPVFRDDYHNLLDRPYLLSFITAPAVNAAVVIQRDSSRRKEVYDTMRVRIRRVLSIAAMHQHNALILGAWGCGVFGNDPLKIAELFAEALHGPFSGVFDEVVFAILDSSKQERFIGPFYKVFGRQDA